MTKFTLSLILTAFSLTTTAQTLVPLPTNELGQLTYSQVVAVENTSQELLFSNAFSYLESLVENHKNLKKGPYANEDSTEVYLPLEYTVYKDFPVHSPHGKIKYSFRISVKEGRYRYIADSFVFYYLERNRYGRFVEVKGKSKPLEAPHFKGNQKLWDKHKQGTRDKVEILTETLRAEMLLPPDGPKEEIVKVEEDW
jgi:hypothetical protein